MAENEANKIVKNNNGNDLIEINKNYIKKPSGKIMNKIKSITDIEHQKKINILTQEVLKCKNEYINCITETEKERVIFNKKTEDILNNLQNKFTNSILVIQNSINFYR